MNTIHNITIVRIKNLVTDDMKVIGAGLYDNTMEHGCMVVLYDTDWYRPDVIKRHFPDLNDEQVKEITDFLDNGKW